MTLGAYAVHDIVVGFGAPLQYSVYLCDVTPQELVEMKLKIREAMLHNSDSIVLIDLGDIGSESRISQMGLPRLFPSAKPMIV